MHTRQFASLYNFLWYMKWNLYNFLSHVTYILCIMILIWLVVKVKLHTAARLPYIDSHTLAWVRHITYIYTQYKNYSEYPWVVIQHIGPSFIMLSMDMWAALQSEVYFWRRNQVEGSLQLQLTPCSPSSQDTVGWKQGKEDDTTV